MTRSDYMESESALRVDADAHEAALLKDGIPNPAYRELLKSLAAHGPEGVLESAGHLPEAQFAELHNLVKQARKNPKWAESKPTRRTRRKRHA